MKHRIAGKKLNRTTKQRQALIKNQLRSLLTFGSIKTTNAKALALRPMAEKFVAKAIQADLNSRKFMYKLFQDRNQVIKVEKALLLAFPDQKSNFIRIVRLLRRQGDDALISKISFSKPVDFSVAKQKKATTPVKKTTKPVKKAKLTK